MKSATNPTQQHQTALSEAMKKLAFLIFDQKHIKGANSIAIAFTGEISLYIDKVMTHLEISKNSEDFVNLKNTLIEYYNAKPLKRKTEKVIVRTKDNKKYRFDIGSRKWPFSYDKNSESYITVLVWLYDDVEGWLQLGDGNFQALKHSFFN